MAEDPLKYFRIEARELVQGLSKGALALEKGTASAEAVRGLLRLAHTLKGAARVVRQPEIAEQAHALEEALQPFREGGAPAREVVDRVLQKLDAISTRLEALDRPTGAPATTPSAPEERFETVRVELRDMDFLLERVGGSAARLGALRARLETQGEAGARLRAALGPVLRSADAGAARRLRIAVEEALADLERKRGDASADAVESAAEIGQARELVDRLRLVPAGAIFGALERAARDAAQAQGKEIEFRTTGGDVRLEANVLAGVHEILLHLVRNAVSHGIEAPRSRAAAGKVPAGLVEIRTARRGHRAVFSCRDDGRGIDVGAVKSAALRRGLIVAGEEGEVDAARAVALILKGGLTTTERADQVSGRGIGLDVVGTTAARLKGEVTVRTDAGAGTMFEIAVPVSLSALRALVVEAAARRVALPLDAVREVVWITPAARAASAEDGESLVRAGGAVPLLSLGALLDPAAAIASSRAAVLVGDGPQAVALGVDRVLGAENLVMRAVPSSAGAPAWVAGASIPEQGEPLLVLDPAALPARWSRGAAPAPAAPLPRVLVVDDSLTTRMLERSILESAGYEVDLAVSGEEGLEFARRRRYGIFVVDVEMPGMDGFEFVRATRAESALAAVPAILVTSRASDDDRRRGLESGARAYLVKSEFDQNVLLRAIAEATGGGAR